jgi:hypothetical protein
MTVTRSLTYEYKAKPEQVAALVMNASYLRRRGEAAGDREIAIEVRREGDGVRLIISRQRTIDLPDFLKGVFQPTHRATESTLWRRDGMRWHAEFSLEVQGMPVSARGRSSLAARGQGCGYESSFDVTARIPLPFVGTRIEKLLADGLAEQLMLNAAQNATALASGEWADQLLDASTASRP